MPTDPSFKVGDHVTVVGVPPDLHDDRVLKTKLVFSASVGHTFVVRAVDIVEGHPMLELHVGAVIGEPDYAHSIWIEPDYVVPAST